MVAVLSGGVGYLLVLVIGKLGQRYPGVTVVGYAGRIVGPWAGKALGLVLGAGFGLNAAVDLRLILKTLLGVYYFTTPTWVVTLMLALGCLWVAWFGIVHTSRLGPLLLAILVLNFLVTFPPLLRWMEPGFLIPLLDPSAITFFDRSFWVALGSFRCALYLVALMPYIAEPGKAVRVYGWAFAFGWLAVLFAIVAPVLVFSPAGAQVLAQPFPYVITIIRLPNFPFERMEMLARIVVTLNALYAVAAAYFCGGLLLAEVRGTRTIRPFMLAVAAVSVAPVVLFSADMSGRFFTDWTVIGTLALTATVFPLLWLIYWLRGLHRQRRPGRRRPVTRPT